MLAYFWLFTLDNKLSSYLIITLVLVNILHLFNKCLPDISLIVNILYSIRPSLLLLLFLDGAFSNVFKTNIDNFKTVLLNTGGSPKIIFKWSQLSIPRYVFIGIICMFLFLFDFYNDNILNTALFIPISSVNKLKYTYGLVLLILTLIVVILRFATSGNQVSGLLKSFFCLDFFKFFLGEKIPGVYHKNYFIDLSDSNWFSIKLIENKQYLVSNNNDKFKCLLLPIHLYMFGLGRVVQVLFRLFFLVLGLLFLMILIFTLFNLIFNYMNCPEFGDNNYSFFSLIKDNFNLNSITIAWHSKSIFSNVIITKNTPLEIIINALNSIPVSISFNF